MENSKTKKRIIRIAKRLLPEKIFEKYFSSGKMRMQLLLLRSLASGSVYAVANLISAIRYSSAWFLSVSIYYFLLLLTRYSIFKQNKRADGIEKKKDFIGYRRAAFIMLLVNAAMAVMIIYTVDGRRRTEHSRAVLIWLALYSVSVFVYNLVSVIKQSAGGSALHGIYRVISFSASLMSLFNFQCSLLSNLSVSEYTKFSLNAISGIVVIFSVITMNLVVIIKCNKRIMKR